MWQCPMRQVIVVELHVPLDHGVCLRMAEVNPAMLDAQPRAFAVEEVVPWRSFSLGRESIGELSAIVGQKLLDFYRRGVVPTDGGSPRCSARSGVHRCGPETSVWRDQ